MRQESMTQPEDFSARFDLIKAESLEKKFLRSTLMNVTEEHSQF